MQDVEFSDEFCRFIQSVIPAVDAAEMLLLFHRKPGDRLAAEEAVGKLGPGIALGDAQKHLESFQARGLLSVSESRYGYRPDNEFAAHVDMLAQAYMQRPVTLIRVIYALRDSKIKSFADAFKLTKD